MRQIRDPVLLEQYLRKYHIRSFFDTPNLPFRLYEYAPGEMINVVHPMEESIKFIVEGVFDHYKIQEDGSPYLIAHCDGFGFMGDLAFSGRQPPGRYQEVIETVRAVELPLEEMRPILENDNRFLRFLIDTMAQRMTASMHIRSDMTTAEKAVIAYLRWRWRSSHSDNAAAWKAMRRAVFVCWAQRCMRLCERTVCLCTPRMIPPPLCRACRPSMTVSCPRPPRCSCARCTSPIKCVRRQAITASQSRSGWRLRPPPAHSPFPAPL